MATTALEEEKRKAIGYSFPQNVPEGGSIYRKRPLASDSAPQGMAIVNPDAKKPLDAQAESDRQAFSGALGAVKDVNQKLGAAIADVGTMPIRAAAGAYDTAVIRPMRAAGLNAAFMSPMVNPGSNADGSSMTPFMDQIRAKEGQTNAIAPVQPSPAAKPAPMGTSLVTASQSQRGEGSMPATPAAPVSTNQGLGIVRLDAPGASPLFTNLPTNDPSNIGLMARRAAPSAQSIGAMDALAGRYEANTTAQAQAMINAEQAAATRMTPGQQYIQQAMNAPRTFKNLNQRQLARIYDQGNRMDSDAARLGADKARMGLDAFKYQDEASTNDLRRKSVQSELDTKAQLDAARQEYLAAGDDPAKQKAATKKLAAFGIKDGQKEGGTWDSIVVGGGVNEQGMKVGGTAMLYNKSTGEVRPIGEQQAQAGAKPAAPSLDVYLAEMRKANPGKNLSDAELKARYEMKFGAQQ